MTKLHQRIDAAAARTKEKTNAVIDATADVAEDVTRRAGTEVDRAGELMKDAGAAMVRAGEKVAQSGAKLLKKVE